MPAADTGCGLFTWLRLVMVLIILGGPTKRRRLRRAVYGDLVWFAGAFTTRE